MNGDRQLWQLLIVLGLVVLAVYMYRSYRGGYLGGDYKMKRTEKVVVDDGVEKRTVKETVKTEN